MTTADSTTQVAYEAHLPSPPSERGGWLLAIALAAVGLAVLVAVLTGLVGGTSSSPRRTAPPAVLLVATTPTPSAAQSASVLAGVQASGRSRAGGPRAAGAGASPAAGRTERGAAIVATPSSLQQGLEARLLAEQGTSWISPRWMEGFYPIYAAAQQTFGVNWLLLASIHRQESAFSTATSTYHGLNFAGCCGGPMQFNVTNGPVTTWQLVSDSYIYGRRPALYDHMTTRHPSIYDDFDSIMAAAHLLSADGAGYALDGTAWDAAYDYYGHDGTGVSYADEVLARAIGWSQHGFCINCGVDRGLVEAVHAAYGAPVLAALLASKAARARPPASRATSRAGTHPRARG
jgi:hypothetical protein